MFLKNDLQILFLLSNLCFFSNYKAEIKEKANNMYNTDNIIFADITKITESFSSHKIIIIYYA